MGHYPKPFLFHIDIEKELVVEVISLDDIFQVFNSTKVNQVMVTKYPFSTMHLEPIFRNIYIQIFEMYKVTKPKLDPFLKLTPKDSCLKCISIVHDN